MTDLYTVLGVSRSADSGEIRKAYRERPSAIIPIAIQIQTVQISFEKSPRPTRCLATKNAEHLYDRYGDIALNPNFKGFEGAEESWNASPFEGLRISLTGSPVALADMARKPTRGAHETVTILSVPPAQRIWHL